MYIYIVHIHVYHVVLILYNSYDCTWRCMCMSSAYRIHLCQLHEEQFRWSCCTTIGHVLIEVIHQVLVSFHVKYSNMKLMDQRLMVNPHVVISESATIWQRYD